MSASVGEAAAVGSGAQPPCSGGSPEAPSAYSSHHYGLYAILGSGFPVVPTTFVLFVTGCFVGMHVADRFGRKAFRPLGVAAGALLVLLLTLVAMVLLRR